jgi:hypothetical protein
MIRFSQHMEQQLADRPELRQECIEATIADPDRSAPDPDPALTRSYKVIAAFGRRVLRVVHRPSGTDVLVVTAHFDRGARRR